MSNPSTQNQQDGWQRLYRTAVLGKYWSSAEEGKIQILKAERAIALRRHELEMHDGKQADDEKERMAHALRVLEALRT